MRHLAPAVLGIVFLGACGGAPPPPASAAARTKPVAVARSEPPPDISPVPEPEGLIAVGRVNKPEAILKTASGWVRLPLPGANELVRSIAGDSAADVVDVSQPVDGAVLLAGTKRDPKPLAAFSVAVRSFDTAKSRLSSRHRTTLGPNGSLWIEGMTKPDVEPSGRGEAYEHDDEGGEGEGGEGCALAHASSGARLVCGGKAGVEALTPYLTRNLPRQQWTSDVHLEIRTTPAREPFAQLKTLLTVLGRGGALGASSPALAELLEAGANELVDFTSDTDKITIDADVTDAGAAAAVKVDYQRAQSFIAKIATSRPGSSGPPPAAVFHLPGDADMAFYGRGSDPQLFQRPREVLGNVISEFADREQMPEAERKALRDLIVDRTLPLFTGGLVYAKGFDQAAVDKAIEAKKVAKGGDSAAEDEAKRALGAHVIGWHLLQVNEPIAKVGPVLKEWASFWARPGLQKWAKQSSSQNMLAKVRIAPAPAGVTLPKDAVHIEITIPRDDLEFYPPSPPPPPPPPTAGKRGTTLTGPVAKIASAKKVPRKPIVLHVIAVPDQGASWLAFGLDGKLAAQKALASLSSAPDAGTFGKTAAAEALRDQEGSGAWLVTLRGLLVLSAMERDGRTPYGMLGVLGNKGTSPIVMAFASQSPSQIAAAGSSITTLKVPRGAIEDIVKIALASH